MPLFNGICNRLIPIMSALRLAQKNNRQVLVYWTLNPGRGCLTYFGESCMFEDIFEHLPNLYIVPQPELDRHQPGADFYNFDYSKLNKAIVNMETDRVIFIFFAIHAIFSHKDNPEDYEKYKLHISGKFEEDLVYQELKQMFKLLKPVQSIQNEINKVSAQFTDKMIGLHIRRTDGMFLDADWSKTDDALIKKTEEWVENGYKIFLATDSFYYEKRFKQRFEDNIIVYTTLNSYKFRNDKINNIAAVVDLYLLSKCNKAIIGTTGSSFSLVASLLSYNTPLWYIFTDPDSVGKIEV